MNIVLAHHRMKPVAVISDTEYPDTEFEPQHKTLLFTWFQYVPLLIS